MDSEASFEDRARQIGDPPDGIAALKRRSLNTFGKFAFLSAYQPGSADEGPLITAGRSPRGSARRRKHGVMAPALL